MVFAGKQGWMNFFAGRIWIEQQTFNPGEEDSLQNNDEVLIGKAQKGDFRSLGTLHDRYRPSIYSYFYYRVDEVATAEDLTSEVFVRMVEKIDTYEPRGRPFLSWLYAIANNLRVAKPPLKSPLPQTSAEVKANRIPNIFAGRSITIANPFATKFRRPLIVAWRTEYTFNSQ